MTADTSTPTGEGGNGENGDMEDGAAAMAARVKEICAEDGFPLAGIAPARPAMGAREAALAALEAGRFAEMRWMDAQWVERATDPAQFLDGARSLVVVALPARGRDPEPPPPGRSRGLVARYARGRDYHRVFERRLRRAARRMREELGGEARVTVDYGPLLERPYAAAAGLGWLGKSTMLLVPGFGPWVLLGVIATTLELAPDVPLRKSCGVCRRCIVACPTGAISPEGGVLDARRCISYLTIEHRGPIPRELRGAMGNRVFGCDDCLDACPVGARQWACDAELEAASAERAWPVLAELLALDAEGFAERFRGTPLMRAKRDGMARNACIALGNIGGAGDVPDLERALEDASPLVRGHAAWALGRIGARLGLGVANVLRAALAGEEDAWVREELRLALAEADGGSGNG